MTITTTRVSVTALLNRDRFSQEENRFFDIVGSRILGVAVDSHVGTVTALMLWDEELPYVTAVQRALDLFKASTRDRIPADDREIVKVVVERVEAE